VSVGNGLGELDVEIGLDAGSARVVLAAVDQLDVVSSPSERYSFMKVVRSCGLGYYLR